MKETLTGATLQMFKHNAKVTSKLIVPLSRKSNTDWKQIAGKDDKEVTYVSFSYGIPMDVIRHVVEENGTSRVKVYNILRKMGYTIDTKNRRK